MILHKRIQEEIKCVGDRIGQWRKMEEKCYSRLGLDGKIIQTGFLSKGKET